MQLEITNKKYEIINSKYNYIGLTTDLNVPDKIISVFMFQPQTALVNFHNEI